MSRNRIIPQMFDVRPVDRSGNLDWKKIEKIEKVVHIHPHTHNASCISAEIDGFKNSESKLSQYPGRPGARFAARRAGEAGKPVGVVVRKEEAKKIEKKIEYSAKVKPSWTRIKKNSADIFSSRNNKPETAKIYPHNDPYLSAEMGCKPVDAGVYQLNKNFKSAEIPFFNVASPEITKEEPISFQPESYTLEKEDQVKKERTKLKKQQQKELKKSKNDANSFNLSDFFLPTSFTLSFGFNKLKNAAYSFAGSAVMIAVIFLAIPLVGKGLSLKSQVLGVGTEGYNNLDDAVNNLKNQNLEASAIDFRQAYENFSTASNDLNEVGGAFIEISRFFPLTSKLSSGKKMIEAGKQISLAGESLNETVKTLNSIENPIDPNSDKNISFLDIFRSSEQDLKKAKDALEIARVNLNGVNVNDLPSDKQAQFVKAKEKLPMAISAISGFLANSDIFTDLLGGNGPRKYLFLFQNNNEMRATGGFIGSYGLLDIYDGRVRKFFIDGIFNPDGQLKDKIVPPKPIQKISTAWSMHDSNWWPDFPTSAQKAIVFYEKTGGPTADGIITFTPEVFRKLLEITGPITMEDYGITLDSDNFIEAIQEETEINYDKNLNQPKKILSDLAPILLDKLFNAKDLKTISQVVEVMSESLNQKQILLYSQNKDLEQIISKNGWSGEILPSSRDYLSVINTNINGYKTDGIIKEDINHSAEIQPDGSITDTVTITRKHNGGSSQFDWWNKVNADYMRVYVPLGSKLISVEGQTREFDDPPLDYDALGFIRDPDIQKEEGSMAVDEQTGTRIYEDSGKTVFANWTYVSPQETVVVKYKYLLPFKLDISKGDKTVDSYSLLAQKQSGSIGSGLISQVKFPSIYNIEWKSPELNQDESGIIKFETKLETDKFMGIVFSKKDIISN